MKRAASLAAFSAQAGGLPQDATVRVEGIGIEVTSHAHLEAERGEHVAPGLTENAATVTLST